MLPNRAAGIITSRNITNPIIAVSPRENVVIGISIMPVRDMSTT